MLSFLESRARVRAALLARVTSADGFRVHLQPIRLTMVADEKGFPVIMNHSPTQDAARSSMGLNAQPLKRCAFRRRRGKVRTTCQAPGKNMITR